MQLILYSNDKGTKHEDYFHRQASRLRREEQREERGPNLACRRGHMEMPGSRKMMSSSLDLKLGGEAREPAA
jgi:hypothetical protein